MDDIRKTAIDRFRAYLERRQFSAHTVASYTLDLHLFSVKAIQKKMERYAKAAGITASCHSLRHTFASNLLEHGAEVVAIRDFLGHSQISSSERYAKISGQKIKQEYMRTMQKILKQGQV